MFSSYKREHRILPAFFTLLFSVSVTIAGQGVKNLPEMTVEADSGSANPALLDDSVAESLIFTPRVQLQTQGGPARQSDISVRGSSFSGAGLAVNGLTLKNPQTEHFNAEFPLPADFFRRPRVLTGMQQAHLADANLVGSVDLQFKPISDGGYVEGGIGERARSWQTLLYQDQRGIDNGSQSMAYGIYGTREEAKGLDYGDNDLDLWRVGGRVQHTSENSQTDLAVGRQRKEFGARGYYGVSPDYFAQEEIENFLVLASSLIKYGSDSTIRVNALWRQTDDDYRLWLPGFLYHNQHRTIIQKTGVSGYNPLNSIFALNWVIDGANEDIDSDSLGDHWRERGGITLVPSINMAETIFRLGGRVETFSDDKPRYLPQLGAEYSIADNSFLYLSYTETTRQPSYTELNYESPGSLGNSGLDIQESRNSELGMEVSISPRLFFDFAGFYRRSENTVDWLKPTEDDRWIASDLGTVETSGFQTSLRYRPLERKTFLNVNYLYLDKSHRVDACASRYVLDYAQHLLQFTTGLRISKALSLYARQGFRWQTDNPVRTSEDFGFPARLEARTTMSSMPSLSIGAGVDNLWNDQFQIIPGQRASDRAFFISARWTL